VSTRNGQSPESQIQALCEIGARKDWEIVDQYVDRGVRGAKGRDKHPEFDRKVRARRGEGSRLSTGVFI
jgi:DNA invertase Pin-like site-specific DNA recombinase